MVGIRWSNSRHLFVVELSLTTEQAREISTAGVLPGNLTADLMAATELVELRNAALPKSVSA